jgi:hypothetical protein
MPDLKFDTIQVGSVSNIVQFLNMGNANGCLKFEFGSELPPAYVNYLFGKATTAEFGVIYGDQVICLLMCQESSLKSIEFIPQWHYGNPHDKARCVSHPDLSRTLLKVVAGMDNCTARSALFGKEEIQFSNSRKTGCVLQVLHDFDMVREIFQTEPVVSFAPVHQCALFKKALSMGMVEYRDKLISLSEIEPLLELLKPFTKRDYNILLDLMRRLLPHPKASAITLDNATEFFDLLEACSEERGRELCNTMQFKIFQLISSKTDMDLVNVAKFRQLKLLERVTQKKLTHESVSKVEASPEIPEQDFDILTAVEEKHSVASKSQPSFMQLFFGSDKSLLEEERIDS